MTKPATERGGGIAGLLFVFCVIACGGGLALDFMTDSSTRFWIGTAPGASAIVGGGVALILIVCAHLVRIVLGRTPKFEREGRGASDHS